MHPVQHFLRGFVGEGEQKNFAGTNALGQQVGDAVGEGARFAGAGPRENEQRTRFGRNGGELLVVELPAKIDRRNAVGRRGWVQHKIHEGRKYEGTMAAKRRKRGKGIP
jgi:hypothetical protein